MHGISSGLIHPVTGPYHPEPSGMHVDMVSSESSSSAYPQDVQEHMVELSEAIRRNDHLYHVLGQPEIPDTANDILFRTLQDLDVRYPALITLNSPTRRIGRAHL